MLLLSCLLEHQSLRVQTLRQFSISEISIHITTSKVGSVVASDDTIRVQDRNYFKNYSFPQILSFVVLREKKPDEAMHQPTWMCLAWMNPSTHENSLLPLIVFAEISYSDEWDINTWETLAHNLSFEDQVGSFVLWLLLDLLNSLQKVVQHGESVRHSISKPYFIFVILESIIEAQLIKGFPTALRWGNHTLSFFGACWTYTRCFHLLYANQCPTESISIVTKKQASSPKGFIKFILTCM